MMSCIETITITLIKEDLPELVKNTEYLDRLIRETTSIQGMPCIIDVDSKFSDQGGQIHLEHFPLHIMDRIMKFKEKI